MLKKIKNYNFPLLISIAVIMGIGIYIMRFIDETLVNKQITGVAAGIVIMIILSFVDYHILLRFYRVFYVFNIIMLTAVLLFGHSVNNATRWFKFGDAFTVQPSELSKIIMIVFMAVFLSKLAEEDEINRPLSLLKFLALLGIPAFLIFREPDLSTTLTIVMVVGTMLFISGLSYRTIAISLMIFIPLMSIFIWYIQRPDQKILYSHQVDRIMSFMYPEEYRDQQQSSSIMAIGSGGVYGKANIDESERTTDVTDADMISEQETDFIFSAIGEKTGFRGSIIIVAIILLIVLQCIRVARRARDMTGCLIASGLACLIGFQSFINIGVATGLLPNTGLPLPFISNGLSSLISISIGVGIVLNISMQPKSY